MLNLTSGVRVFISVNNAVYAALLMLVAIPVHAVPNVDLGCAPGVNFAGCTQTLSNAEIGTFSEPASFDITTETFNAGLRGIRIRRGSYEAGNFDLFTLAGDQGAFSATPFYSGAFGTLTLDDLIFSYTGGGPAPTSVFTSLNFNVGGNGSNYLLTTEVSDNNPDQPSTNDSSTLATNDFQFSANINGTAFSGRYVKTEAGSADTVTEEVTGLATQIAGGAYVNDFDTGITTGIVEISINTLFAVTLDFQAFSGAGGGSSIGTPFGWAQQDLYGLGWFAGMEVFNFDGDFTVNSESGLIVNNCFIYCESPSTVPEPAALVLLGIGLTGLGLARRRVS